ncbi:dinucleotide-utilizing enzyme [Microbacterium sp. NPDC058389]|uniref:dinucleotide-utilizing enzyme n=1 Tax=Microbacterium sp. NPDC058389 TaxID=3346475 RepID=UPI00364F5794
MSTRPRLARSIPFWGLLVVSLGTAAAGAFLLTSKVESLTAVLTDNSATAVDVYVGQVVAITAAILLAAGIVGILLTLTVAALATLRPVPAVEVVEPIDWKAEADEVAAEPVVDAEPVVAAEPVVEAEPVVAAEPVVEKDSEATATR